jgi:hypothetical protein
MKLTFWILLVLTGIGVLAFRYQKPKKTLTPATIVAAPVLVHPKKPKKKQSTGNEPSMI